MYAPKRARTRVVIMMVNATCASTASNGALSSWQWRPAFRSFMLPMPVPDATRLDKKPRPFRINPCGHPLNPTRSRRNSINLDTFLHADSPVVQIKPCTSSFVASQHYQHVALKRYTELLVTENTSPDKHPLSSWTSTNAHCTETWLLHGYGRSNYEPSLVCES